MGDGWEVVYLGLGSNMGDREATLQAAIGRLAAAPGVRVLRRSSLYESEPVGVTGQPWFLNAVLEIETSLDPESLLRHVKAIEAELGRRAGPRWGPRPIDIDILLYGQQTVSSPELHIPHKEMWHRLFVLVPLAELSPELVTPDGTPVKERVVELRGAQEVRPLRG